MAVQRGVHPSADVLKAFGLGKLDDSSSGVVMNHLDQCQACRQEVASLSGDDFLNRLRQAHGHNATPAPANVMADDARAAKPPTSQTPIPNLPSELANNPQYEIVRELGRGGMGVVYLAKNKLMDRLEVLKVVNKTLLDHPGAIERFLREIRSAAKLSHANVVAAYSALQVGELLAFAMEYVEGEDLADLIKSQGPLPVAHACFYVQQAALGLQHAFEKQMVHRDIKPQNLILAREGKKHIVKVLDFGLAKVMREKTDDTGLTGEGKMLGTPDYIAPEQTLDAAKADIRADIYSLGCTLYFLLSGRPPFSANSLGAMLLAHQMKEAKPLNLVRPEVPEELAAVVRKMMAKSPAKRYQTPLEVVQALSPFVKQATTPKSAPELSVGTAKAASVKAVKMEVPPAQAAPVKPPPPVPESPPPVAWESLTEGSIASAQSRTSSAVRERRLPAANSEARKKWLIGGGIGVGVLLLALLGMWASGVFQVKTKDGILIVEVNEPYPDVYVDGEKVTVSWDKGGKKAEIRVKPGTRKVEVKKDGFSVDGKELTFKDGDREIFTARLLPEQRAAKTDAPADAGFVPLFNGKDRTGWKSLSSSKAIWEVKDGVLIGSGDTGYLFNDGKRYENFHLRIEVTINDGGNSGVFFRAPFGPTTPRGHPSGGYEAQINITHKDPNKTGSLYLANNVVVGVPKTLTECEEWFTLEVIADGPHVVVKVNGKDTANFIDLTAATRGGRIALQVLDAATVVKFRKVEIKELPAGDLRLRYLHGQGVFEQVKGNVWLERRGNWHGYWRDHARDNIREGGLVWLDRKIEDNKSGFMHITRGNGAWWNVQGTSRWSRVFMGGWSVLPRTTPPQRSSAARVGEWAPLLNGKNLSGWETTGNQNVNWTYGDDALVGRSSAKPAGLLLSDRADYMNFHLRMETQLSEGAYSSLFLRCGPPNDGAVGNKCYAIRIGESNGASPITGTLALSAHLDDGAPLALADAAKTTLKPGEWFPLEVIAEGNHLRVLIGGQTKVDYTDTNETFTVGRLGLVCRAGAVVKFRKLEIKELPPTRPAGSK